MIEKLLSLIIEEKKLIIISILASMLVFGLYTFFLYCPYYESNAKIFIRNIPKYSVTTDNVNGDSIVSSESGYSNPLFNLVQLFESKNLSSRVYKYLVKNNPDELKQLKINTEDDFHGFYKGKLKTKIIPSTDTLALSLSWPNKDKAGNILLETIQQFRVENLELRKSVETKQREYIDDYLREIENKLALIGYQIRNYRIASGVIDANIEGDELVRIRVQFEKEIEVLKGQINYTDKKLADLSKQLGFKDAKTALRATAIGQDPYLESLTKDLALAQQKYANLRGKFADGYPEVAAVDNEINIIKSNINNRYKESLQGISVKRGIYDKPSQEIVIDMARVQAEKASLIAQLSTLKDGLNSLKSKEVQFPDKILKLEELRQQESVLRNAYDSVKKKQLDAKFKENEIVDNIFILDYPSSAKMVTNDLILKLAGFLYAGLLIGIIAAWFKNNESSKLQIETAGTKEPVPDYKVIGSLPYLDSEQFNLEYMMKPFQNTESAHGTAYLDMASNLIKLVGNSGLVSFISSGLNRKSSFIVPNIAASLVRQGKSVIFINCDLTSSLKILEEAKAKPVQSRDFIRVIDSINRYLTAFRYINDNYIRALMKNASIKLLCSKESCLTVPFLPITNPVENFYDYVSSKGFMEVIKFLRANYDYILVDLPAKPASYKLYTKIMEKMDINVLISGISDSENEISDKITEFRSNNIQVSKVISRDSALRTIKPDSSMPLEKLVTNINTYVGQK